MAFIRARTVEVRREANEALDLGMETSSQADVGAALQVFYNLHELTAVDDAARRGVRVFRRRRVQGRVGRRGGGENGAKKRRGIERT